MGQRRRWSALTPPLTVAPDPNPNPIPNPNPSPSPNLNQALGRLGAKHPQWVDAEGLSARLVPMLDDADRIVRASAALAVGMLKLQAGAEKLCLLWRNDPISHVRDAALTAMKSVGGPLIEDKLRIEKVLSTHCSHNPDPTPTPSPNPTPNPTPTPTPTPTPNQVHQGQGW